MKLYRAMAFSSLVLQPRVTLLTIDSRVEQSGALSATTLIRRTFLPAEGTSAPGAAGTKAVARTMARRQHAPAMRRLTVMGSPFIRLDGQGRFYVRRQTRATRKSRRPYLVDR